MKWLTVVIVVISTMLFGGLEAKASGDISNFRLPFEGGPYEITQGPRCVPSHNDGWGIYSREALDIGLGDGTQLYATEAGMADYKDAGSNGGYCDTDPSRQWP